MYAYILATKGGNIVKIQTVDKFEYLEDAILDNFKESLLVEIVDCIYYANITDLKDTDRILWEDFRDFYDNN